MIIKLIFSLISLSGIQGILFPGPTVRVVIQFSIVLVIGYIFFTIKKSLEEIKYDDKKILRLFLYYSVFVLIHSCFVANEYDQWRYLLTVYAPTLLLPFFCTAGTSMFLFFSAARVMIYFTSALSILFLIRGPIDKLANIEYIKYTSYIYALIIFSPVLKFKTNVIIFTLAIFSLFFDISNRSNILSIVSSFVFLMFYVGAIYLTGKNQIFFQKFMRGCKNIFLYIPILLLILGGFGIFNVFEATGEKDDFVLVRTADGGVVGTVDSRTTIYQDAIKNLNDNEAWFIGTSATHKYNTGLADALEGYDGGRLGGSESSFLGLLTFGGIFYVAIAFIIFYRVSSLAINNSNSFLLKTIGVYLSFKWFFMFIESPFNFNIYWITTFMLIGLVFGSEARKMTDKEIKNYISINFNL
jgi:hypothetical protein